ncbi:MAG: hypothetical protein ACMG6E_02750 [Candidatus Roizmanbacteria bacterium]
MKNKKSYVITTFLICVFAYISGNYFPIEKIVSTKTKPEKINSVSQAVLNQGIMTETDIPIEYFDHDSSFDINGVYLDMVRVIKPPVAIDNPDLSETVSKPFIEDDTSFPGHPGSFDEFDPVDVDNDGEAERIYYVPVAENHGAAYIQVLKGDKVFFQSKDSTNRLFEPSPSGNGFYLIEGLNDGAGSWNIGARKTRYIYKDKKFVPVWYQEEFKVKASKQVN